jgi:hypothetical protein
VGIQNHGLRGLVFASAISSVTGKSHARRKLETKGARVVPTRSTCARRKLFNKPNRHWLPTRLRLETSRAPKKSSQRKDFDALRCQGTEVQRKYPEEIASFSYAFKAGDDNDIEMDSGTVKDGDVDPGNHQALPREEMNLCQYSGLKRFVRGFL